MIGDELAFAPAIELARLIDRREVSPVELLAMFLERIERIDTAINSIVTIDADRARAAAREAERRAGQPDTPPFLGVPIAIKDLHATRGMRTTLGTKTMADWVPQFDDESVARVRRAGFVIFGKTNTGELGTEPITESRLLGPCRNPWDQTRTAGGSSGGAAAAVAAGLLPVAHGSDSGGSLRIPASCCGVVGLKPSRGRISNAPRFGDWFAGLGSAGPIGRHVVDVAALLDAMRGYAPGDPHWAPEPRHPYRDEVDRDPQRLRVGLVLSTPIADVDPQVRAVTEQTVGLLVGLGHDVEPLDLPVSRSLFAAFGTVWAASLAALDLPVESLDPFNAGLATQGRAHSAAAVLQAMTALQRASREIVAAGLAFDVLLSPTIATLPVKVGAWDGLETRARFAAGGRFVGFTPIANVTGVPAISLPLGRSDDGLPIGVMLTGRPADETTLIRLSAQLERAADWTGHRPPVVTQADGDHVGPSGRSA